jgi:hypothetical protein
MGPGYLTSQRLLPGFGGTQSGQRAYAPGKAIYCKVKELLWLSTLVRDALDGHNGALTETQDFLSA